MPELKFRFSRLFDDELEAEIAWHRSELTRLQQQQRHIRDARLLQAIFLAVGAAVFDVVDVFEAATLHPALQAVLEGVTPNQLGRWVMRLTNRPCGGLVVQLVTRTRTGRVYAIVPRHSDAGADDEGGAD